MKKCNKIALEMKLVDENDNQIKSWCGGIRFDNKDGGIISAYRVDERFKVLLGAIERAFLKRAKHFI